MMDGVGDMNLPPDAMMHQPAYPNDTNIRLKMDPSEIAGPLPLPKPRRKRQRKVDKPPKPPAERKKRGRKSKMEKLMAQAAADARHAGLSQQPGGEWARAKGSGMFMPGEMMNGPQHHESVVKDVNMRRASLENQMSEVSICNGVVIDINLLFMSVDHSPIRQTFIFENNFSTVGKSFLNLVKL